MTGMQHTGLAEGRWKEMPFQEQAANLGGEIHRTLAALKRQQHVRAQGAFERACELFDLTIEYGRVGHPGRYALLKEICRARELFCEAFLDKDIPALNALDQYFGHFATGLRLKM